MRSIDPLRRRAAPLVIRGRTLDGVDREWPITNLTLLLVVKADCQACDALLELGPEVYKGFDVYFLTADSTTGVDALGREVLRCSSALDALEVRWPPVYLVVDPARAEVVAEGVVFDAAQILEEISHLLSSCVTALGQSERVEGRNRVGRYRGFN